MVLRAHSGTGSTVFHIPQFRPDIFGQLCATNLAAGANHDNLPLIALKDTDFALTRTAAYIHVQDHFLPQLYKNLFPIYPPPPKPRLNPGIPIAAYTTTTK